VAEPSLRVVFEDRWLIVVDKDAGLPSQGTRAGEAGVFERLRPTHAKLALHHRLDRSASGLLVLARHPDANAGLARAFATHTARREYHAVLCGDVGPSVWSWPIDGERAVSRVEPLGADAGFVAARMTLETGRKHQLRRHAALAGAPIAGDRRYGGDAALAWPRLALHATRLSLRHPVTGVELTFDSPLPPTLTDLWALARGP
jgi:23S rRNA-/tRNA-specific pseudouridylate synthase